MENSVKIEKGNYAIIMSDGNRIVVDNEVIEKIITYRGRSILKKLFFGGFGDLVFNEEYIGIDGKEHTKFSSFNMDNYVAIMPLLPEKKDISE